MGGGKNAWFQPFAHALNLPRNLGNRVILVFFHIWIMHMCYFGILPTCFGHSSDSDDEFSIQAKDTVTGSHGEMTEW